MLSLECLNEGERGNHQSGQVKLAWKIIKSGSKLCIESVSHFHKHGSLFCIPMRTTSHLASLSRGNFGSRSQKSENSEMAYSNVSKEMQNDEHMDSQTDEKMKAQRTRTAKQPVISKWF